VARQLAQLLDSLVMDRRFCTGVQASIRRADARLDYARGELAPGEDLQVETLYSVHCATKPVLSVAVGRLISDGRLDPTQPVSTLVADSSAFAALDVRLWDVLRHTSPLARPLLIEVNLAPLQARRQLLESGIDIRQYGYSEYASQVLLAELIEGVTRMECSSFIAEGVLAPLGLDASIRFSFDGTELDLLQDQIGCYVAGLPDRALPLLSDRSPHQACLNRVALGGYASAKALSDFYHGLVRVYGGEVIDGLPHPVTLHQMLSMRSERRMDPILGRESAFAGGFMIDLHKDRPATGLSSRAFGHTGLVGSSFGFADPATGVAGSFVLNGLSSSAGGLSLVTSGLVAAVLADAKGDERG
jgi:CubicO group peptidase (beta-lactamase class C family)